MDGSQTYTNVKFTKTDSRSPTRAEPDVSYAEVNFKTPSATRVRTDRDALNCTYSELNFWKAEARIDQDENLPNSSGPGGSPNTAQTGSHKQELIKYNGNRSYRKICLLCLVTFVLVALVAGLSIYVSQIRQSEITCDRNCHGVNSNLQSNLSELNSNLSDLIRIHSDLRQQFTEMETKYRSVNETKAQICELLTSRREEDCSEDWVRNGDRCYFFSTSEAPYDEARQRCSSYDSRLLEINLEEEANFVFKALHGQDRRYWIGKCKHGKVASNVVYQMTAGDRIYGETFVCATCKPCDQNHYRFICEKSAPLRTDISEKIQDLCQHPVGPT